MGRLDVHAVVAFTTLGSTIVFIGTILGYHIAKDQARSQQVLRSKTLLENGLPARHESGAVLGSDERKCKYKAMPHGIESCIGNTPLFRIKSLSDATGCEILGKAEVWLKACIRMSRIE